jgi:hypothetical protein
MQQYSRGLGTKYMLTGGVVLAAMGLIVEPRGLLPKAASAQETCQAVIREKAVLSRDQLAQLSAMPERASKAELRALIQEPYCRLGDRQLKSGNTAQQEAYPLAFDPKTWFVVLYEGDTYAGYTFNFRR